MTSHRDELDRHFATIEGLLPRRAGQFLRWLREPSMVIVRVLVSVALIIGGIFSFLPVLGIWMLPLGLILIAQDIPFLQPPLVRALTWIEVRWLARKARAEAAKQRPADDTKR